MVNFKIAKRIIHSKPSSSSFLAKNQAKGDSQPVINITLPGADTCIQVNEMEGFF